MLILGLKETYENLYKIVATRLDAVSIGIILSVLIVVFFQRKLMTKRIFYAFLIHGLSIVIALSGELVCWYYLFDKEHFALYKIFYFVAETFTWIMPATMFYLIQEIVKPEVTFNKKIFNCYIGLFVVLPMLLLIPSFRNLIYYDVSELAYCEKGVFYDGWFMIESVIMGLGIIYGTIKSRKIGLKDALVVNFYACLPLISSFIDEWWASTISMLFNALALIILYGFTIQNRMRKAIIAEEEKRIELAEAKSKLLLAQIQPHFIYNTLTTLKFLCETNPTEASSLCDSFSNYLRANIDAVEDDGLVSFEKELENITNYLEIEKSRFGNRVKYIYDIKAKDFMVPVLTIQTIVENAVKKGICKKKKGGTITISTYEDESYNYIKVVDDGIGFNVNEAINDGKNHIGISNTTKRLEMIGGTIDINSIINEGTTVTIRLLKGER